MLQDGIEEALGLARAGAGGDQSGLRVIAAQAGKGAGLMGVGHEIGGEPGEGRLARIGLFAKRQRHREIRPSEQIAALGEERFHQASKARRG